MENEDKKDKQVLKNGSDFDLLRTNFRDIVYDLATCDKISETKAEISENVS
jgi:hypothetical protein